MHLLIAALLLVQHLFEDSDNLKVVLIYAYTYIDPSYMASGSVQASSKLKVLGRSL